MIAGIFAETARRTCALEFDLSAPQTVFTGTRMLHALLSKRCAELLEAFPMKAA